MKSTFRSKLFAGLTAATFCLVLMSSNQAAAQVILPRGEITQGYYSPYSQSFDTEYRTDIRGGRIYRFREFSGYRGNNGYGGYNRYGYGQGPYGYELQDTYVYPPAASFRQGTYYRGGYSPQFRTFGASRFGNASRRYSPYRYGRN